MKREYIVIAISVGVVLLIAGAGILLYGLSQGATLPGLAPTPTVTPEETAFENMEIPKLKVTPPPSLAELAAEIRPDYPELADLLENPELGSVYKDFYLAYQSGGEETALALARQRGILNDQEQVVMTLVLDTEDSAGLVTELEAEGIVVVGNFRNLINIAIPVSLVQEQIQAEEPDLILDRLTNLEHVVRVELPHKATPKQGTILGQGVNVTFANSWHKQGLTGKGVKVGVLDIGFAGYEDLLGRELPETVTVEVFGEEEGFLADPHGAACAEIVHEMAPDAELYLAYYDGTDLSMGLAVTWLVEQGVDIISNSTGSNGLTPMDGTGFIAELVDEVHDKGIFWVNAAGNEALNHHRTTFTDANGDNLHEFFPDVDLMPFIPYGPDYETSIIVSWDDWQSVDQDYDLLLLDEEGNVIAESAESQSGEPGEAPVEGFIFEFDNSDIYYLAIENYEGQARGDALFDIFIYNGDIHPDYYVAEYSLSNPADARGAFAVGAVHWSDDALENYSSHGPTTDGRTKPDLAAPSVVDSASYTPEAFNGTSAATPHVAGAAALILQAFPDYSPDQIAAFLQERAIDLGPTGPDNTFGGGRLNLGAAPDTETAPEETPPPPAVELQPTSTPRPEPEPSEVAAVGLPRPEQGQEAEAATSDTETEGSAALGVIMILGLCLVCLGALLIPIVIIGAVVMTRRKRK
jgi:subtilisin family serine protease